MLHVWKLLNLTEPWSPFSSHSSIWIVWTGSWHCNMNGFMGTTKKIVQLPCWTKENADIGKFCLYLSLFLLKGFLLKAWDFSSSLLPPFKTWSKVLSSCQSITLPGTFFDDNSRTSTFYQETMHWIRHLFGNTAKESSPACQASFAL